MLKKRFFLFCVIMMLMPSLLACGFDSSDSNSQQISSDVLNQTETDNNSASEDEQNEKADRVEKPSEVNVNDASELTREQRTAWTAYFVDAYKNMDMAVIEEWTTSADFILDSMKTAAENEDDAAFFRKIMKEIHYFPKYDILVGKDPYYILAKAYSEVYSDTSKIALSTTESDSEENIGKWSDVTLEYANEIYEKYWEGAPYIIISHSASDMLVVQEGQLKTTFNLGLLHYFPEDYASKRDYYGMSTHFVGDGASNPHISYGNLLFGTDFEDVDDIPKGSYGQFWDKSELITPEVISDINLFYETYKQLDSGYEINSHLYSNYLKNAPDDTNYNAFVENFNNGRYKIAVYDRMIMYYMPYNNFEYLSNVYYYNDADKSEKLIVDSDILELCEKQGITLYQKTAYAKTDAKSCLIYPINGVVLNMEREGLLTKYE